MGSADFSNEYKGACEQQVHTSHHVGLSKVSWVAHEGWQHGKSIWVVWFVEWQTKEVAYGQLRSSWLSLECAIQS